jgi:hypothetical protein
MLVIHLINGVAAKSNLVQQDPAVQMLNVRQMDEQQFVR